jgi:hypothetical protein
MNNDKHAIAKAMLEHLTDRLVQFWEGVACDEFPQDRTIRIRFDAATIDGTNEKLLASAREYLKSISPLLTNRSLDPTRLDQFAMRYLTQAKEEVERKYDNIEAAQYGYGEVSE